jgi:sensor histidine kinase YesM
MPKYNVLMTINQYVEMDGETAEDAEIAAWKLFRNGDITIDESPIFICDECDLIEEENQDA